LAATPPSRRLRFWLILLAVLVAVVATALYLASRSLKPMVEEALGPRAEIGAIRLNWGSVEIEKLRIRAPRGWPAMDELRAEQIRISPDLRGLFSRQIVIRTIEIDGAYMSLLRTTDGRLRMLPSLLEKPTTEKSAPLPAVRIGHIGFTNSAITLYDASIRRPPLPLRTEQIRADIDDIQLPSLAGRTRFDVGGTLKGVRHDGTLSLKGWAEIASRDSEMHTRLRGVDLLALQPYLIKAARAGVKRGRLDLDIDARVKSKQLRAPGTVTLRGLELDPGRRRLPGPVTAGGGIDDAGQREEDRGPLRTQRQHRRPGLQPQRKHRHALRFGTGTKPRGQHRGRGTWRRCDRQHHR
jgi:hypothetical protein